jgi:tetratricopeptide (TPR) repeat protein
MQNYNNIQTSSCTAISAQAVTCGNSSGDVVSNPDMESGMESDIESDIESDMESDMEYDYSMLKNEPTDFIGLKALAHLLGVTANRITKYRNLNQSLELYLDAILIDPQSTWVGNVAILYEIRLKDKENAIIYYKMAIENDDVHSMYNLADLYKKCNELSLMIKYYEMAAQRNDIESVKILTMFYFDDNSFELFSKHYNDHLTYTDTDNDYYEFDAEFRKFLEKNTILSMIGSLETVVKSNHVTNTNTVILLNRLRKLPDYSVYKNKIALFTRLNCIEECNICYDTKLNIDIHCGHTMCGDCYSKLYTKDCPFCRLEQQYYGPP